jgi:hypothetical protein
MSHPMNAARDLLFGVLALQLNFIDRHQLVAALDGWSSARNKSIGPTLVEMGALDAATQSLLDALTAEQLKRHGDDAAKCLDALGSTGSARSVLEHLANPDVRLLLAEMAKDRPVAEAGSTARSISRQTARAGESVARERKSRFAVWLPRLTTSIVFLVALGYLLHTSHDPVVLGKYDAPYAIFLAVLFLVILPAIHYLTRFCAVAHVWKSRSGRTLVVRPRYQFAAVAVLMWFVYVAGSAATDRYVRQQTMTYNANDFHPYLQNTPRPGDAAQQVNRWGFRGDDLEQAKGDDVFRIFMFGGSTAYCGTVPYEQTHCRVMEKRLRQAYPQYKIEVQNLGADWHTTEHDTIKLLFFAQDFSPDVVIIFHAINDLVRSFTPDAFGEGPYWPDYRHYLGAAANLASGGRKVTMSVTAGHWCSDLLFDQIRVAGPEGKGINGVRTFFVAKARPVRITEWKSLPAFERNLRDFVAIARSKEMQVLLATQPSLYRDDLSPGEVELLAFPMAHHFEGKRPSLHSMVEGMRQFNDTARRLAAQAGVDLVDLERQMPKSTDYLFDDVHYTEAGNKLIGDALADRIIESKTIDRVMDERRGETESAR